MMHQNLSHNNRSCLYNNNRNIMTLHSCLQMVKPDFLIRKSDNRSQNALGAFKVHSVIYSKWQ